MREYERFLYSKRQLENDRGFDPIWMPDFLFDFQKYLTDWAIRKGRAAIFADCGLGKTPMQLVWAQNVVEKTNRAVLILTPIAVGIQTIAESKKFAIHAERSRNGSFSSGAKIIVTNYEQLHKFDSSQFAGVVCDESSILKNFDGIRRKEITEFMRTVPYRLLCTATAAPNDFTELGTSSEALGTMGYQDVLTRFFKNDQNTNNPNRNFSGAQWRFRGHAERDFWRWVCSWSRAIRKPSDYGFDDGSFTLPPIEFQQAVVKSEKPVGEYLFRLRAHGLAEQRSERARTVVERCEKVASLVNGQPTVCWCHLNREGDLMESMIPGAVQVSGKCSDEEKEERLSAFTHGKIKTLVTKPTIAGFGLNWQHCSTQTFFPSHSFEQWYQSIRRSWRFGQRNKVTIHMISSDGEADVQTNLERKSAAADRMFSNLIENMQKELSIQPSSYGQKGTVVPPWLS